MQGGGEQVGASPKAVHDYMMSEYTAKEEGFVYVYVSNESATLVEIYEACPAEGRG
jgi:hypothetical protein